MVNTAPLFFFWLIRSFLKWGYITERIDNNIEGKKNIIKLFWQRLGIFLLIFLSIFIGSGYLIDKGTKDGQPDTIIEKVEKIETSNIKEKEQVEIKIEKETKDNTVIKPE